MILVFIFLLIILIIYILLILILSSKIQIEIQNAKLSLNLFDLETLKIEDDIKIKIKIFLFYKIKILQFTIDDNLQILNKIKKINYKKAFKEINDDTSIIKELGKIKVDLSKFDLKVYMGVDNVVINSFTVGVLSSIISIILAKTIAKFNNKNHQYKILPLYNQNKLKIDLNCIINVKVGHIIHMLFNIYKRKGGINGRASNRRTYDYSYE